MSDNQRVTVGELERQSVLIAEGLGLSYNEGLNVLFDAVRVRETIEVLGDPETVAPADAENVLAGVKQILQARAARPGPRQNPEEEAWRAAHPAEAKAFDLGLARGREQGDFLATERARSEAYDSGRKQGLKEALQHGEQTAWRAQKLELALVDLVAHMRNEANWADHVVGGLIEIKVDADALERALELI